MTQKVDEYLKGRMYEILIRRAFNYNQGQKQIGYWENDFQKVKWKVEKALEKFLTKKFNDSERQLLLGIKDDLSKINDKDNLYSIITELLKVTRNYK